MENQEKTDEAEHAERVKDAIRGTLLGDAAGVCSNISGATGKTLGAMFLGASICGGIGFIVAGVAIPALLSYLKYKKNENA